MRQVLGGLVFVLLAFVLFWSGEGLASGAQVEPTLVTTAQVTIPVPTLGTSMPLPTGTIPVSTIIVTFSPAETPIPGFTATATFTPEWVEVEGRLTHGISFCSGTWLVNEEGVRMWWVRRSYPDPMLDPISSGTRVILRGLRWYGFPTECASTPWIDPDEVEIVPAPTPEHSPTPTPTPVPVVEGWLSRTPDDTPHMCGGKKLYYFLTNPVGGSVANLATPWWWEPGELDQWVGKYVGVDGGWLYDVGAGCSWVLVFGVWEMTPPLTPTATPTPTPTPEPCPVEVASGSDWQLVEWYRWFRDEVLITTPTGQEWVNRFYRHTPEVALRLAREPELRALVFEQLVWFRAAWEADEMISKAEIKSAEKVLEKLAQGSSRELKADLKDARQRIKGDEGQPLREAVWQELGGE